MSGRRSRAKRQAATTGTGGKSPAPGSRQHSGRSRSTPLPTHDLSTPDISLAASEPAAEGRSEHEGPENVVVSVVLDRWADDGGSVSPGHSNDGRGTLGLCPPPRYDSRSSRSERENAAKTTTPQAVDSAASRDERQGGAADACQGEAAAAVADGLPESLRLLDLVGTDEDPYREGCPWAYAKEAGGRCFFITTNERHDDGRVLLDAPTIEKVVRRKGMTQYAWVKHDADCYTAAEVKKLPGAVQGEPKADHYHVAILRKSFASIAQIATAFGVPPNQVETKPQSAFFDLIEYETHEHENQQAQGKHLYPDEAIHTNIEDWRTKLEEHKLARSFSAGKRANAKKRDRIRQAVMHGEMTLRQVRETEPMLYAEDLDKLQKLRKDFLLHQPPPRLRITYYIEGAAGSGKTFLARLLAEALFPDMEPEEAYFESGAPNVALQSYGGQPVIIWDDYRAGDLVHALGGRTSVWRAFDPAPGRSEENIKNGSVRLVQSVNIVTGVTPYREFCDGLAGSYKDRRTGERYEAEDANQGYRRVRFIHRVSADEIEVLVNAAAIHQSEDWQAYQQLMTMNANCRALAETIDALETDDERDEYRRAVGDRVLGEMVLRHHNVRPSGHLSVAEAVAELDSVQVISGDELKQQQSTEQSRADEFERLERLALNQADAEGRPVEFVGPTGRRSIAYPGYDHTIGWVTGFPKTRPIMGRPETVPLHDPEAAS